MKKSNIICYSILFVLVLTAIIASRSDHTSSQVSVPSGYAKLSATLSSYYQGAEGSWWLTSLPAGGGGQSATATSVSAHGKRLLAAANQLHSDRFPEIRDDLDAFGSYAICVTEVRGTQHGIRCISVLPGKKQVSSQLRLAFSSQVDYSDTGYRPADAYIEFPARNMSLGLEVALFVHEVDHAVDPSAASVARSPETEHGATELRPYQHTWMALDFFTHGTFMRTVDEIVDRSKSVDDAIGNISIADLDKVARALGFDDKFTRYNVIVEVSHAVAWKAIERFDSGSMAKWEKAYNELGTVFK